MKNIVICADGTGNSAIKGRGTNVFTLFEAVDVNGHRTRPELTPQVALYDSGVGTEHFIALRAVAAATGHGLRRKLLGLHLELARLYEAGDNLFLFGFSRGAFTVRALVALISALGIIEGRKCSGEAELRFAVRSADRLFKRRRYSPDDRRRLAEFKERYSHPATNGISSRSSRSTG